MTPSPELPPLDPQHVVHYVVACEVARVSVVQAIGTDLRTLIERVSRMSIPDAAKFLRKTAEQ